MTGIENTSLRLIGEPDLRIYGLPVRDWQTRNWRRGGAGADAGAEAGTGAGVGGVIVASATWVLSSGLAAAIARTPGAALVEAGRLVAANVPAGADPAAVEALVAAESADDAAIRSLGLSPGDAVAIAGSYNAELRKREAPFAIDVATRGVGAAQKALFRSSYKGVTDLVTKYAWPAPAYHVTRACAALGVSPNAVTWVSLVFCLAAMWFFWNGDWALGFASGWLMTFLDTVDGKLARTTLTSSKLGEYFDHGIDLIHPPFWYVAWFVGLGLGADGGGAVPGWAATSLWVILALYVGGRIIEGLFIRAHGFHIHVWRRFDSILREVTARRNPNMLIFMIFTLVGAPAAGLAAVAIWSVACNAIHIVRLFQAGLAPATPPRTSWMNA